MTQNKQILVFGASSSRKSINKQFAEYAAIRVADAEANCIDLNDYEMPIFSVDREEDTGIPAKALAFKEQIRKSDGIIMSFAEHNSAYSAAFKNIYDWVSRIEKSVWLDKPLLLLATAPGQRGGKNVLQLAYNRFSRGYNNEIVTFSLPNFNDNFSPVNGITDEELNNKFLLAIDKFSCALHV